MQPSSALYFLADGLPRQVSTLDQLGVYAFVEGGIWVWPPIASGFQRSLELFGRAYVLTTLSIEPKVFEMSDFLSDEEVDTVMTLAEPHMRPSEVTLKDKDVSSQSTEFRTSTTYFLHTEHPTVLGLDHKIQTLTRIPIIHAEDPQILRYEVGQFFMYHHDFFATAEYSTNDVILNLTKGGAENRALTVFMYLNNVTHGGETGFPYAFDPSGRPYEANERCPGMTVAPTRKKILLFYNLFANGMQDDRSTHTGCEVVEGIKWSANYWVWNAPQNFRNALVYDEMAATL